MAGEEDSEPQQTRYTLEGAGEGGILLGYVDERDLSSDYQILFYPWHRIVPLAQDRVDPPVDGVADGSKVRLAYSPNVVEEIFSEVPGSKPER